MQSKIVEQANSSFERYLSAIKKYDMTDEGKRAFMELIVDLAFCHCKNNDYSLNTENYQQWLSSAKTYSVDSEFENTFQKMWERYVVPYQQECMKYSISNESQSKS